MATLNNNSKTVLNITTSVGVVLDITVDNEFQDIAVAIALSNLSLGFAAVGSELRNCLEAYFLPEDQADVFSAIFNVANAEMKRKLVMK